MELRIGELQELFQILVTKLEKLNLNEFKFESDNYWVISPSQRMSVHAITHCGMRRSHRSNTPGTNTGEMANT